MCSGCSECSCNKDGNLEKLGLHFSSAALVPTDGDVITISSVRGPVAILGIAAAAGLIYYAVATTLLTGF